MLYNFSISSFASWNSSAFLERHVSNMTILEDILLFYYSFFKLSLPDVVERRIKNAADRVRSLPWSAVDFWTLSRTHIHTRVHQTRAHTYTYNCFNVALSFRYNCAHMQFLLPTTYTVVSFKFIVSTYPDSHESANIVCRTNVPGGHKYLLYDVHILISNLLEYPQQSFTHISWNMTFLILVL